MKILIIDDDFVGQEKMVFGLGSYGVDSHVASDVRQAVEAFERALDEKEPYQLISMDLDMSGSDSLHLLQKIRTIEKGRGINMADRVKVFVLSASNAPEDIARSYREGQCDSYLTKPLDMDLFVEQLQKVGLALPENEEKIFLE